jgi:hypothetical protein
MYNNHRRIVAEEGSCVQNSKLEVGQRTTMPRLGSIGSQVRARFTLLEMRYNLSLWSAAMHRRFPFLRSPWMEGMK